MSGASGLAYGSWADAESLIGEVLVRVSGPDAVSLADIRRKLEVLAFDCPLHYDEACAREHGYRTVVSPVSMTRVWTIPSYWHPGEPQPQEAPMQTMIAGASIPGEGNTLIATKVRMEHHTPLYPGDRLEGTAVLKSVERKTTRIGPGAFLVVETTYVNQSGDTVSIETVTLFRFDRGQGG